MVALSLVTVVDRYCTMKSCPSPTQKGQKSSLAFAFSLSAEIERGMISSRTKEALARKKSEGKRLGRPKGRLSTVTKLSGKDDLIREYLVRKIPVSVIARLLGVSRLTVRHYIRTRKLQKLTS